MSNSKRLESRKKRNNPVIAGRGSISGGERSLDPMSYSAPKGITPLDFFKSKETHR